MKVPIVPVGTVTVTLFPVEVIIVWLLPPLIVYVKVYGAVPPAPVNVIFGELASLHTAVVPLIVAVGNGLLLLPHYRPVAANRLYCWHPSH